MVAFSRSENKMVICYISIMIINLYRGEHYTLNVSYFINVYNFIVIITSIMLIQFKDSDSNSVDIFIF